LPLFEQHYNFLSGSRDEEVNIQYKSDCTDHDFGTLLKNSIRKDMVIQRTSVGIHRDDFVFSLNGHELKRIGSQGQQKSFLIGLKLAEFQSIETVKGMKPLLLLDDIFDKLDDERIHKLVNLVADGAFGQLFITDARPDRSQGLLKEANIEAELFLIENGKLIEV
jgi:DNA replication and repair protein RecF